MFVFKNIDTNMFFVHGLCFLHLLPINNSYSSIQHHGRVLARHLQPNTERLF